MIISLELEMHIGERYAQREWKELNSHEIPK